MSLVYWLQQPGGTLLDITDRCRLYRFDMKENAEEGSVAVNQLVIDDPDGTLEMYGHRTLAIEETTAVDPDDRFVFVGFIGSVTTNRGPYRTTVARQYVCEVSDVNALLMRRVMIGTDNDRPEETDNARIAWLVSTHESVLIEDTRFVKADQPWDMDEADYTTQDALSVYDDCSQQSGANYFLTYFGDVGVTSETPWGQYSLWYEYAETAVYSSTATLTNILADVDVENGAFYIGVEDTTSLLRDPMRVYSHIVVPYIGGYELASNPTTVDTFARRDRVMPALNVRRASTAAARARRYVRDLATPEDRATIKTTVPRSLVNLIRPGMQVPVKVTHWPGYADDYLWMRVLSRRVVELSEEEDAAFELTLELSRGLPGPAPGPLYGVLYGSGGPYDTENGTGLVHWANPGDTPGPGWEVRPTTGLITMLTDATPPHPNRTHYGWQVTGTGTINVRTFLTTYGILLNDISYTWTCAITKNGTIVASEVFAPTPGNLVPQGWDPEVTISGLAVVPGDIIETRLTSSPSKPAFWRTPRGSGQNGECLEITGGSLT